jgi:hypothetical protein
VQERKRLLLRVFQGIQSEGLLHNLVLFVSRLLICIVIIEYTTKFQNVVLHASPLRLQRRKMTMPSPNKFVRIVMSLNPLPKCIFPLPIADARVLGNVQHAQADLTLLVSGKILVLLGTGR